MSDVNEQNEHAWARERMATALAGGLSEVEMSRLRAHVAGCHDCGRAWEELTGADEELRELFAGARPREGLEDRVIQRLRRQAGRRMVPPVVRYAVTGIAAAVVVGGIGVVVHSAIEHGGLPGVAFHARHAEVASNLRQIGESVSMYQNENQRDSFALPAPGPAGALHGGADKSNRDRLASPEELPSKSTTSLGARFRSAVRPMSNEAADLNGDVATGDLWARKPEAALTNSPVRGTKPAGEGRGGGGIQKGLANKEVADLVVGAGDGLKQEVEQRLITRVQNLPEQQHSSAATPADAKHFKPMSLAWFGQPGDSKDDKTAETKSQAKQQQPTAPTAPMAGEQVAGTGVQNSEPVPPATTRKIIRNGSMEFEVDRFDSAYAIVSKLTTEAGGYISSTDSDKLPNGKVKGTVVVRVPPEKLDTLVLQLRSLGDLKSQKLEAQDISKQYQDLDSELTADRAMEGRLLELIKNGKGNVKDLLAAEKELGVWRQKIEKIVGQMKYYDNLVALSTLSITLYERDIKTAAAATETETVDTGIETTDVEKARSEALKAIDDARGRIIQSDLKRYDAGQFGATIVADVSPERAGAVLDRIKQLGKVARLDVQRKQTGSDADASTRVEQKDTRFNISLYNLANVSPRTTTNLNLAADDAEAAYHAIIARVQKAGGRIVASSLNRGKDAQITGTIGLEVPSADADAFSSELKGMGEVMKLEVTENPDAANVTTAKRGFNVQVVSVAGVAPRETEAIQIAASDVGEARNRIVQAADAAGARVLGSTLNESDRHNVTANLDLEIGRAKLAEFEKTLSTAGDITSRNIMRSSDTANTVDSKVRYQIAVVSVDRIAPRQTTTLAVEVANVDTAMADVQATAAGDSARIVESNLSKARAGRTIGHLVLEVPLERAGQLTEHVRKLGTVRVFDTSRNEQAPEGKLAKARIEITLGNAEAIVAPGQGVWASVRQALATSATGLLWSLQVVIIGLCFVLPWVAVLWGGWKLVRRGRKTVASA